MYGLDNEELVGSVLLDAELRAEPVAYLDLVPVVEQTPQGWKFGKSSLVEDTEERGWFSVLHTNLIVTVARHL